MRTLTLFVLFAAALLGSQSARAECSHHLLVSGYFSNEVAIFDACDGSFLRPLDNQGRIQGAQAVRLHSDGRLYLVSEGNGRILRYDSTTYAFVDVFAQLAANVNPTGIDFGPDGHVYVASYGTDSVLRLDGQTGAVLGTVLPSNSGLGGPDNGMGFGPDGLLYVPGYDSSSIARVNLANGQVQANYVSPGSSSLFQTRGILFEPGGETFLVSGEGSGAIYRYRRSDGAFLQNLVIGLGRPTGMVLAPDGSLLVLAATDTVYRFNRETGALLGSLLDARANGVHGGTFLTLVPIPAQAPDAAQIGTQYWIAGAGMASESSIDVELFSATGTAFGADFDPATVVRKRWGSMRLQFQDCDRATFSYDSNGPESANFGSLSYPVARVIDSEAAIACRTQGFGQVSGNGWMSGTWFNEMRSGEGVLIEVGADGTALAGFFTHLPDGF